jgi:regulator of replication initiation timing
MNNEIKKILEDFKNDVENNLFIEVRGLYYEPLLDYITNLQTIEREYSTILSENAELQQENERLKEELNCKEYFSSTMPEDTEFVILTKNNYDRQQKDIQLELIDYKSRCEKAIEYIQNNMQYDDNIDDNWIMTNDLLNILQNRSEENDTSNK